MKSLIPGFMLLFYFSSCTGSKVANQNQNLNEEYTVLYMSEYGGSGEDSSLVITEAEKFANFWNATINEFYQSEEVPQVDFKKEMVVVRQFESRNYGGDEYHIESVEYKGSKVFINYKITSAGDMGTTAITKPMIILSLRKTNDPEIEFIQIRS